MTNTVNDASICLVIPAFNEEECIAGTINSIRSEGNYHVVVVDDGSTDQTERIAKSLGVKVLKLKQNHGVGSAFRRGVLYAKNGGYEFVIQLDADGQHDPVDVKTLVRAMSRQAADVVIGSRYVDNSDYRTPLMRLIGIRALSIVLWLRTGVKIYDPTSGYRMYNKKGMFDLLEHSCGRCTESYMTGLHIMRGRKVVEAPVNMKPRQAGKSKLTVLSGFKCLLINIWRVIWIRKR